MLRRRCQISLIISQSVSRCAVSVSAAEMAALGVAPCHVRWAHAANTTALLDAACRAAERAHFIEADILCVDGGGDAVAVMGHDAHAIAHVPRDRLLAERTFSAWLAHALELMRKHQCVFGVFAIGFFRKRPATIASEFRRMFLHPLILQVSSSTLKTRAQLHLAFSTCALSALHWTLFRFG